MSITIGLGEFRVGGPEGPDWVMHGLGSCIGLIVADRFTGVSAVAHVVLPTGTGHRTRDPAKYADRVVPFLLDQLARLGGGRERVHAYMAGGARMFEITGHDDIGRRNAQVVQEELARAGIPLVAADVGGSRGRTLWWSPATGVARITQVGCEERVLTPVAYRYGPLVRARE